MVVEAWEIGLDWIEQLGGLCRNSTRAGKYSVARRQAAQKSNRILKSEASSLNLRAAVGCARDDFGQQTSESEAVQSPTGRASANRHWTEKLLWT